MTSAGPRLLLSRLLRQPVMDDEGNQIATLADLIVRLDGEKSPEVTGLVASVGSHPVFVSVGRVLRIDACTIVLDSARLDLRPFGRREGEVLLKGAVLGHRLIDVDNARLVRAYDVEIDATPGGWMATGLDVHARPWYSRRHHTNHAFRDWTSFDVLIGHEPSAAFRSRFKRLRGLRPAQIADLIEDASSGERDELFEHLHADPELEADVMEELDDDQQSRALQSRDTAEIAAVLGRMHADDVVDAIVELPKERRQPVLDALPLPLRHDVFRLMAYQRTSAGGMMGVEYLTVHETATAHDALSAVRQARAQQPQALSTLYLLDDTERLVRSIGLVALVQAKPSALLSEISEAEPVSVTPEDDVIEVLNVMADYNLLAVPVVDDRQHIIGVITVDDALEEAIPADWRQRGRRNHTQG